jgi:putative oxidoreductase
MKDWMQGGLSVVARTMMALIFLLSAVGNKIPQFSAVAEKMELEGVPVPGLMLVGAIGFLVVGSVSVIVGLWTRVGAGLLLVFLILATYYFHDFWAFEGPEQQAQMIQFMKNVSLMGGMLFLIANGAGGLSLDARLAGSAD